MLNISEGGLVVYGSFIAVMIAVAVFVRKYRVPGLALADLITPSMLLGLAFGRIGCLMNGCCFGGTCELPWSVEFPWGSPPHVRQVEQGRVALHGIFFEGQSEGPPIISKVEPGSQAEQGGLRAGDRIVNIRGRIQGYGETGKLEIQRVRREVTTVEDARRALLQVQGDGATLTVDVTSVDVTTDAAPSARSAEWTLSAPSRSLPVHPAQVYSAIDALLICLFLLAYAPYRRSDGEVIGITLLIYPIARFLEETVRIDEFSVFGTGLSISQNISLLVFAAGVVLWCFILTRPARLAFGPAAR